MSEAVKITDEVRASIAEQMKALDDAGAEISKLIEPLRRASDGIEAARILLLDSHGVEIADTCEGCSKILFVGEMGHVCGDGPTLCEACSPTWADCLTQLSEPSDDSEDEAERQESIKAVQAQIDAGNGDKKHVWEL